MLPKQASATGYEPGLVFISKDNSQLILQTKSLLEILCQSHSGHVGQQRLCEHSLYVQSDESLTCTATEKKHPLSLMVCGTTRIPELLT